MFFRYKYLKYQTTKIHGVKLLKLLLKFKTLNRYKSTKNMFLSKLNALTGTMEWVQVNEDYDYQQELARAGYADMLHDYERVKIIILFQL